MKKITYNINGSFIFDPKTKELRNVSTKLAIDLELMLANLLHFFIINKEDTLSRDTLISKFWDTNVNADEALTKAISKLRKVLNDNSRNPELIKTINKKGYRWMDDSQVSNSQLRIPNYHKFRFNKNTVSGLLLVSIILMIVKAIIWPHH